MKHYETAGNPNRKRFEQAFAPLHAPEDTLEQVARKLAAQRTEHVETNSSETAPHGNRDRTGRSRGNLPRRRLGLVLAACALVAGCGVAFATGAVERIVARLSAEGETPQTMVDAYSDAIPTEKPTITSAAGTPIALPDMQRQSIDATTANSIIGGYASSADASVTAADWTVTLDSFVADKNGLATLVFTAENPNGVGDSWDDAGYGEVYNGPNSSIAFGFETVDAQGSRHSMNRRFALIEQTDTSVTVATYLCAWDGGLDGRSIEMTVEAADHSALTAGATQEDATAGSVVSITPETLAPSTALVDDEGNKAVVSPLGLYYESDVDRGNLVVRELVVAYADGSEYVVESERDNVLNMLFSTAIYPADSGIQQGDSGRYVVVFNRLVDVDQVESVRLEGAYHGGEVSADESDVVVRTYELAE